MPTGAEAIFRAILACLHFPLWLCVLLLRAAAYEDNNHIHIVMELCTGGSGQQDIHASTIWHSSSLEQHNAAQRSTPPLSTAAQEPDSDRQRCGGLGSPAVKRQFLLSSCCLTRCPAHHSTLCTLVLQVGSCLSSCQPRATTGSGTQPTSCAQCCRWVHSRADGAALQHHAATWQPALWGLRPST